MSEAYNEYVTEINKKMREKGIRSNVDISDGTISKKIKLIRTMRPSYILVVGEKELANNTLSVRNRKDKTREYGMDEFMGIMAEEIREKKIDQAF